MASELPKGWQDLATGWYGHPVRKREGNGIVHAVSNGMPVCKRAARKNAPLQVSAEPFSFERVQCKQCLITLASPPQEPQPQYEIQTFAGTWTTWGTRARRIAAVRVIENELSLCPSVRIYFQGATLDIWRNGKREDRYQKPNRHSGDEKRLWSRIKTEDSLLKCWEWNRPLSTPYPKLMWRGHQWFASRASYESTYGVQIPDGLHIDHLCSNPKCCNPTHLQAVEPLTNYYRGRQFRKNQKLLALGDFR